MNRKRITSILLALASVLLWACSRESRASTRVSPAPDAGGVQAVPRDVGPPSAGSEDPVRAAFSACPHVSQENSTSYGGETLVCVIGENHAKVASQIELAETITKLLDTGRIDAILVEGSNGLVDVAAVREQMAKASGGQKLDGYWQRLLEQGQLAGYERVVLANANVPVYGVEDMVAKEAFAASFVQLDFNSLVKHTNRSHAERLGVLDKATKARISTAVSEAIAKYRGAVTNLEKEGAGLLVLGAPLLDAKLNQIRIAGRMAALSSTRQSAREAIEKRRRLTPEELQCLKEYGNLREEFEKAEQAVAKAIKVLEPKSKAFFDALEAAENDYCRASNAVRSEGEVAELSHYFSRAYDAMRKEAREDTADAAGLHERDVAMVQNSADYLRVSSAKRVILVIGSHHLSGVRDELEKRKISYVSGSLESSNAETEHWENRAWEQRTRFVPALTKGEIKEPSLLQRKEWGREQAERLRLWGRLNGSGPSLGPAIEGSSDGSKMYAFKEGKRWLALRVVPEGALDLKADFGAHLLARMPTTKKGEFCELYDRDVAREIVDRQSNDTITFAYGYLNGNGDPVFMLPGVPESVDGKGLRAERDRLSASNSKLVVFNEPAERETRGRTVDVVGREMYEPSDGGAGGNKKPPGNGGPGNNKPPDDPEPRGSRSYRTINSKRAVLNLTKIAHQDPSRFGNKLQRIDVMEGRESEAFGPLMHTPSDTGEYGQMLTIVAKNTAVFRDALRRAAADGKLRNKQVALITCGDAFLATAELREYLLQEGVLTVWTPAQRIDAGVGKKLGDAAEKVYAETPANRRDRELPDLMLRAIQRGRRDDPENTQWDRLEDWDAFTLVTPVATGLRAVA